jgi:hypothetical protein
MIKRIKVLQNACSLDVPTVKITSEDQDWQAAYDRWIFGKHPTSASGWKEGVYLYDRSVEIPREEDIYERWTKKYSCQECGKERVQIYCLSCVNIKADALKKKQGQMIDVLAETEAEKALSRPDITPEMYRAFVDLYGSVNAMFGQLNRFFGLFQTILEQHGGQLHNPAGCQDCVADHRKWLDENHKNWQNKSNATGGCRMCIEHSYKELSASNGAAGKPISSGKAAPRAISL